MSSGDDNINDNADMWPKCNNDKCNNNSVDEYMSWLNEKFG